MSKLIVVKLSNGLQARGEKCQEHEVNKETVVNGKGKELIEQQVVVTQPILYNDETN